MGEYAATLNGYTNSPQGKSLISGTEASLGVLNSGLDAWSGIMKVKAQRAVQDANTAIRESGIDIENAQLSEIAQENQRKRLMILEEQTSEIYAQNILSGVATSGSVNASIRSAMEENSIADAYDQRNADVDIGRNRVAKLAGRASDAGNDRGSYLEALKPLLAAPGNALAAYDHFKTFGKQRTAQKRHDAGMKDFHKRRVSGIRSSKRRRTAQKHWDDPARQ